MSLTSTPLFLQGRDGEVCVNSRTTEDTALGRELKLSPKSHVKLNTGLYELKFFTPTVELMLQIGNHTAYLIMTRDAWESFNLGTNVRVQSLKQYRETS